MSTPDVYQLFAEMRDPVACYDVAGTIVFVNDAACAAMARRREQLIGANVWQLYPEAPGDSFHAAFQTLVATGRPATIDRYYAHLERWYTSDLIRLDGLVIVITRDVTDERRATDRISVLAQVSQLFAQASDEARFEAMARLVAEHVRDLCVIRLLSRDGERFEAPVGAWDPDPDVRAQLRLIPEAPRDSASGPSILRDMQTVVIAHAEPDEATARLAPGGQEDRVARLRVHSAMIVPLRAHGRVIGIFSLARRHGGTARPYSAEDRELAEELAARVALVIVEWQSRAALSALVQELQTAVAARDEFLSVASHELRTPLAGLELQLHLLGRELADSPSAPKTARALRQVTRLTSLVDKLLDVTRLSRDRLELDLAVVDLGELLRDVVERSADEAHKANTALVLEPGGEVRGHWDRFRLDQMFTNLISNAIKYGRAHPVTISTTPTPAGIRITVRDRGIGIAPADATRIFDRFERAVSSDHFSGLGLGLYIARQVACAHGGTITVESGIGEGSSFNVELPLREPPDAPSPA